MEIYENYIEEDLELDEIEYRIPNKKRLKRLMREYKAAERGEWEDELI